MIIEMNPFGAQGDFFVPTTKSLYPFFVELFLISTSVPQFKPHFPFSSQKEGFFHLKELFWRKTPLFNFKLC
jgi:hypothetical protein